MKKTRKDDDITLLASKFSASVEPPPEVRKWFRISMVLSSLMGMAYVAAFVHNYYASNNFKGDGPFSAIVLLAPFFMRATYYRTKKYLEANWHRIEALGTSSFFSDYDTFSVQITKLFLLMSFVTMCAEIIGRNAWHNIIVQSLSWLTQIMNFVISK